MPVASVSGIVWYLSSMFIGISIIYPFVRRHYTEYCKLIAPILSMLILGILIHTYGTLNVPAEYLFGIINTGNLRSIAFISLGCFVYEQAVSLNEKKLSKKKVIVFTLLEIVCYVLILLHMHLYTSDNSIFDEQAVILMVIGLTISLSDISIIGSLLKENRIAIWLGKYSGALFFGHFVWVQHPKELATLLKYTGNNQKIISIVVAFGVSFILMMLSLWIKSCSVYKNLIMKIST